MEFKLINIEGVDDAVIEKFDSGSHAFNRFLNEKAKTWNATGEAVTYVFVDETEAKSGTISRIYGYASINALGLQYENNGKIEYLPCAEIRLFTIAKQLRKHHDITVEWSSILFKILLQELYYISTHVIGFKAIFLNANHDGYQLYKSNGFSEIGEYAAPQSDPKIDIEDCVPLLLVIDEDMIYDIFI